MKDKLAKFAPGIAFISGSIMNFALIYHLLGSLKMTTLNILFIVMNFISAGLLTVIALILTIPKGAVSIKTAPQKVEMKGVEIPQKVRIISSPFMRPIADRVIRFVEKDMEWAGVYESPQYFISTYLLISIIMVIVLTPLTVYLAITINPLISFLMTVPLIVIMFPKLNLILKKAERKDAIKDELPFFTAYAMIYQAVGKPLPEALVRASQSKVFKQISKEGVIVGKHLMMGEDDVTALSIVSRTHPNESFRTLLLGYTSVLRSGGDLLTYLETKLKDFIEEMKFRWQKYVEDATNISELVLMLLFIFPTLMMAGAFILPGESLQIINLFTIFGIPLLFTIIFVMTSSNQPKTGDRITIPIIFPLIPTLVAGISMYLMGIDRFVIIASCITIYSSINGGIAMKQLREIDSIDNDLPRFLRDITEYRKMGYDLVNAIIISGEEGRYSKAFMNHLKYIATQLRLGRPMRQIIAEINSRSMLENITLELLATGIEEGEIKPTQLETLIDFISTVNRTKRETRAKLRLNTLISFIAPIGLIVTTYLIAGVMTYFTSSTGMLGFTNQTLPYTGQSASSKLGLVSQTSIKPLIDSAKALMIVSSFGIGLLSGKISSFTAKDTVKLAVVMGVTVIALLLGNIMTKMFMKLIMGGGI